MPAGKTGHGGRRVGSGWNGPMSQAAVFREFQQWRKKLKGHSPGPKNREKTGRPDNPKSRENPCVTWSVWQTNNPNAEFGGLKWDGGYLATVDAESSSLFLQNRQALLG